MQQLHPALAPLAAYTQFMLYKKVQTTPGQKATKIPCNIYGQQADAHDPRNWITAEQAITTANMFGDQYDVAFVFTENDPFFFLDIDDCAIDGQWNATAQMMLRMFPGAAVEVSTSGNGLHIFGTYTHCPEHSMRNADIHCEFYTSKRFVALTGNCSEGGSAAQDCTAVLPDLINNYFKPKQFGSADWTEGPVEEYTPINDEELIRKACAKKSVAATFGQQASFEDLWLNRLEVLVGIFPDQSGADGTDGSRVDAALAQHLAFWTGKDCARMERLMRQSALERDKWDWHGSYLKNTILGAVSMCETVYTGGKKQREPTESVKVDDIVRPGQSISREAQVMPTYQFMGITEQLEYFKNCVYVASVNSIIDANGRPFKQEQFNNWYGGYEFAMDHEQRKTTRKAWEAFTQSLSVKHPKADKTCFRPLEQPGAIIDDNGTLLLNTYVEINTPRKQGDVTPFLNHVAKLLPDERDRQIVLSYMAACVQHKGHKFQWAPLIQGAEGNGKSLFSRCVAFAVGQRYTATPQASEIGEKFNEWIVGKLFVGVEDIYLPDHKREVIEILKPMITNDRMAIRAMGRAQEDNDNYANFIFNSNHRDAIRKTKDDRRFAVFYTAQQTKADIDASGMGGSYFPKLYNWLKLEGGYAMVNEFLHTYKIPDEFNPTVECQRAPITSSTDEAVMESMGMVEQRILQAIEEQQWGFAGGWVSSKRLDTLINSMYVKIPPSKHRGIMQSLGYDWHPNLKDGRPNNPINGERCRLYIKNGHINCNIEKPSLIAKKFQADQDVALSSNANAEQVFGSVPVN